MTLPKGLYDRLIFEDEVGEVNSLASQHRAMVLRLRRISGANSSLQNWFIVCRNC
jgi:hypothetical protein